MLYRHVRLGPRRPAHALAPITAWQQLVAAHAVGVLGVTLVMSTSSASVTLARAV